MRKNSCGVGTFLVYLYGYAGITQLVECNLAKVDVAGSSPVSRSVSKMHSSRDTLDETIRYRRVTVFERRPEKSYLRMYPAATNPTGQRGFCSGAI